MTNELFTVDIGNGHVGTQLWRFQDKKWRCENKKVQIEAIDPQTPLIYSSVTDFGPSGDKVINCASFFSDGHFFDMPVHYTETLGIDRLVQAFYLYKKINPDELPIILIDMGTFTTVDIIDKDGLQGGHILPGSELIQLCYAKGAKLSPPGLESLEWQSSIPNSTEEAIQQGFLSSVIGALKLILDKYPASQIHFSGGSAQNLRNVLSTAFESESLEFHESLIHESLLLIYRYLDAPGAKQ